MKPTTRRFSRHFIPKEHHDARMVGPLDEKTGRDGENGGEEEAIDRVFYEIDLSSNDVDDESLETVFNVLERKSKGLAVTELALSLAPCVQRIRTKK